MDFGALPPEVNSGRMYTGAGPGPMLAAAAAWDALAGDLSSIAASYQSVITELTGEPWRGPAATSMSAAAAPHATWMHTSAVQAQHASSQARAVTAAYESAFAATVPPAVIEANRAALMALVATNFLGQNSPAIAANHAHYAEMWAQDASAMYDYAGTTATATTLTPFTDPYENSNSAGPTAASADQSGGDGSSSSIPDLLQSLSGGSSSDGLFNPLEMLNNALEGSELYQAAGPVVSSVGGLVGTVFAPGFAAMAPAFYMLPLIAQAASKIGGVAGGMLASSPDGAGETLVGSSGTGLSAGLGNATAPPGSGRPAAAASLGRAAAVGGLSVPQTWGTPQVQLASAASSLPQAGPGGLPATAPAGVGGVPPVGPIGSVVNAPQSSQPRLKTASGFKVIPELGRAPDPQAGTPGWPTKPTRSNPGDSGALSEHERDEFDDLRKEFAELAVERDTVARLIEEATRK